jgi:hypothetical protein
MPAQVQAQWSGSVGFNDDNALQLLIGGEHWQIGPQYRAPRDCRYFGGSLFYFSSPFSISAKISTRLFLGGEGVYLPYQKGELNEGDGWGTRLTIGTEFRIVKSIGISLGGGVEYTQRRDKETGLTADSGVNLVGKTGISFWR